MFEKYIECPSCHFGGYEFCPECLGAGGYVIQIEENPNHNIEVKIDTNLITQINNTLNIIDRGIQECTYYKKINWKESFSYLKKALKNLKGQQSIEVLETQKHIIKLWKDLNLKKRFQEEVDILNGLTSYDIKIQLFDNQIYINDPNEVEFKKSKIIWEFFNQKPQETYLKITPEKSVFFPNHLMEGYIKNLAENGNFAYNYFSFIYQDESINIQNQLNISFIKFEIEDENTITTVLITEERLKSFKIKYLINLQVTQVGGWRYI